MWTSPEYMSKKGDELNEFIEEVTDGSYNLSCHEVILKFVNQMKTWGDSRIKKIVTVLVFLPNTSRFPLLLK